MNNTDSSKPPGQMRCKGCGCTVTPRADGTCGVCRTPFALVRRQKAKMIKWWDYLKTAPKEYTLLGGPVKPKSALREDLEVWRAIAILAAMAYIIYMLATPTKEEVEEREKREDMRRRDVIARQNQPKKVGDYYCPNCGYNFGPNRPPSLLWTVKCPGCGSSLAN